MQIKKKINSHHKSSAFNEGFVFKVILIFILEQIHENKKITVSSVTI